MGRPQHESSKVFNTEDYFVDEYFRWHCVANILIHEMIQIFISFSLPNETERFFRNMPDVIRTDGPIRYVPQRPGKRRADGDVGQRRSERLRQRRTGEPGFFV